MTSEREFRRAYAEHRQQEGRGAGGMAELLALPYLTSGAQAKQWQVRARTFEQFVKGVVQPSAHEHTQPLRILDVGAGNGWLCYRLTSLGYDAVALDWRADAVDGLGAAAHYAAVLPRMFPRVVASFDALPLPDASFDLVVFNATLHYALDLARTLQEAVRVAARGGHIVILDSPFYASAADGERMVQEKRAQASRQFGANAGILMSVPFIEYLTPARLRAAAALDWRRLRVRYPLWYELRPLGIRSGQRRPSRFDIWEARVA